MRPLPFRPRPSGASPERHWVRFWVLVLPVPAFFALVTMPVALAAVAVVLSFGLPLAISLARHAHDASEQPAKLTGAIRSAAVVSVTCLGLVGLFAFSAALALAILAAYVATVGLTSMRGKARPEASPGPATARAYRTTSATDEEDEARSVIITADRVRRMSDAELCDAWRRSFMS